MSSDEGALTPLPPSMFARLATAARFAITGVAPTTWFGPQQPLAPMAPPQVKGRQFDYLAGLDWVSLGVSPSAGAAIGVLFIALRAATDSPVFKSK